MVIINKNETAILYLSSRTSHFVAEVIKCTAIQILRAGVKGYSQVQCYLIIFLKDFLVSSLTPPRYYTTMLLYYL